MPKFPIKESDIVALAEQMVAGLTSYPADFPSVEVVDLQGALADYKSTKQAHDNAKSQSALATVTKDDNLATLIEVMKNDLKLAEVDRAGDPTKLTEIGWGPRANPQPITVPGCPTDLDPIAEGTGTLSLSWNKPVTGSGGPVRNYIIERRQQLQPTGEFGQWSLVTTTYNCQFNLENQPQLVRLEYRVKASNTAGESVPSNTVSVILP